MNPHDKPSEFAGLLKALVTQPDLPLDQFMAFFNAVPFGVGLATDRECRFVHTNVTLAHWLELPEDANVTKIAPDDGRPAYRVFDSVRP